MLYKYTGNGTPYTRQTAGYLERVACNIQMGLCSVCTVSPQNAFADNTTIRTGTLDRTSGRPSSRVEIVIELSRGFCVR
jgi:hypothetical protein